MGLQFRKETALMSFENFLQNEFWTELVYQTPERTKFREL